MLRVSHVGHSRRREINTSLYYYAVLWVLFENIIYTSILAWLTQNDGETLKSEHNLRISLSNGC